MLGAPDAFIRPWRRKLGGVLSLAALLGTISVYVHIAKLGPVRYLSYPLMALHLVKHVSLLLCFLELREPRRRG